MRVEVSVAVGVGVDVDGGGVPCGVEVAVAVDGGKKYCAVSGTIANAASRTRIPAPMPNMPREAFKRCSRRASSKMMINDGIISIAETTSITGCTTSEGDSFAALSVSAVSETSAAKNTSSVSQKPILARWLIVRTKALSTNNNANNTAAVASKSSDKSNLVIFEKICT